MQTGGKQMTVTPGDIAEAVIKETSSHPNAVEKNVDAQSILLASHVFLCETDGDYVFLDIAKDNYTCIMSAQVADLMRLVKHGAANIDSRRSTFGAETLKNFHALKRLGMVTTDYARGKPFHPVEIKKPRHDLSSSKGDSIDRANPLDIAIFYGTTTAAFLRLKYQPLQKTVHQVQRRKMRKSASGVKVDKSRIRLLSKRFLKLRSLFPSTGLCLFNSYALIEYLAFYNAYPDWKFGVRTRNWEAHCWVEFDGTVLNDPIELVAGFKPIMVV